MVDLARRAHLTLETGATSSDRTATGLLARLTQRELEVLRHVARGANNDEIAAALFISPRTASVHVSRILTKLDVSNRSKAAAVAYQEGLAGHDPLSWSDNRAGTAGDGEFWKTGATRPGSAESYSHHQQRRDHGGMRR